MLFSSNKDMNRLISKAMSIIYLKVTIEKKWRSRNFDFLSLKNLTLGQFLESSNSRRYNWVLKPLVATYKSEVWDQNCVWVIYYFNFERNYVVLKSNSPHILLNKDINFNRNKTGLKMENPTHSSRDELWECKNCKIKIKLWWVGLCKRKNRTFTFYLTV